MTAFVPIRRNHTSRFGNSSFDDRFPAPCHVLLFAQIVIIERILPCVWINGTRSEGGFAEPGRVKSVFQGRNAKKLEEIPSGTASSFRKSITQRHDSCRCGFVLAYLLFLPPLPDPPLRDPCFFDPPLRDPCFFELPCLRLDPPLHDLPFFDPCFFDPCFFELPPFFDPFRLLPP